MVLVKKIWVFVGLKLWLTFANNIFEYNITDILENVYLVGFQFQYFLNPFYGKVPFFWGISVFVFLENCSVTKSRVQRCLAACTTLPFIVNLEKIQTKRIHKFQWVFYCSFCTSSYLFVSVNMLLSLRDRLQIRF